MKAARYLFRNPLLAIRQMSMEHAQAIRKPNDLTVNKENQKVFQEWNDMWWSGGAYPLHALNKLRVPFLIDGLANTGVKLKPGSKSLEGLQIMEAGCGGGILSEPLARAGADVTGLDSCKESLEVAREHAAKDPSVANKINYVESTIEDFAPNNLERFDAVISSEVVEHVNEPKLFLEYCVKTLKPGGSIFITTLNRTILSYIVAIIGAEYIFNAIPKGTHDWNKFLTPDEIRRWLEACDCKTVLTHGMFFNVMTREWSWSSSTQISYALHAVKSRACTK